ncbi:MAG: DUF2344 domain-containing protein [Sedimentisphaerales bacterium]|nr:DUF2344 domain-containing protein [Sedimentisphaerales bacterium]
MTDATAAVRFAIGGMLRFLSHAETLRVFQRACARAAVPVKFSEGFNPHPKLSLPLPRPVGVESADELLVVRLFDESGVPADGTETLARTRWQDRMKQALTAALPEPIKLRSVALHKTKASFSAESVDYEFMVRMDADTTTALQERAASLEAAERIEVERVSPCRPGRRIDVRGFLKSLRLEVDRVVVTCAISTGGSIRVDEIMRLLELTVTDLACPVRRTNVVWTIT